MDPAVSTAVDLATTWFPAAVPALHYHRTSTASPYPSVGSN